MMCLTNSRPVLSRGASPCVCMCVIKQYWLWSCERSVIIGHGRMILVSGWATGSWKWWRASFFTATNGPLSPQACTQCWLSLQDGGLQAAAETFRLQYCGERFLCVCVYGWVRLGNSLVVIIVTLFLEFAGSSRDRGACGNAGHLADWVGFQHSNPKRSLLKVQREMKSCDKLKWKKQGENWFVLSNFPWNFCWQGMGHAAHMHPDSVPRWSSWLQRFRAWLDCGLGKCFAAATILFVQLGKEAARLSSFASKGQKGDFGWIQHLNDLAMQHAHNRIHRWSGCLAVRC